jgi:hypothetical protein
MAAAGEGMLPLLVAIALKLLLALNWDVKQLQDHNLEQSINSNSSNQSERCCDLIPECECKVLRPL